MKVIIHGGFFSESTTDLATKKVKQAALKHIVQQVYANCQNQTAVEAVVYAVSLLEDDPLFNAGIGSQIQSDGQIRMSAAVMDGESAKFGGVINVQHIQNPIQMAHQLMDYDDRVLGGEVATAYARQLGIPEFSTEIAQRRAEYEAKLASNGQGTVGCVVLDNNGKLAVATSTGGKGFEIPGRISDSATVAGNYANTHCAVSCTGVGEDIVSGAVAVKIVTRVTDGMSIQKAFAKTFEELLPYDGFCGAIGISQTGEIFHQDSHPKMVYASYDGTELHWFDNHIQNE